jgi:uncharacterized protein (DUF58 family)
MTVDRERNTPTRPSSIHGALMPEPPAKTSGGGKVKRRRSLMKRLPTTREGVWFLCATLVVGAAAVNAGLNLLFLVFGMMLFLILASGIMSEWSLRKLVISRKLPTAIHAGSPFLMGISVRNAKSKTPTFSLEVEDLAEERPVERRCYFLKIPAGREQETAYRNVVEKRGIHKLVGFRVSTRFPFGLIRKSFDVKAPAQMLVYPALRPVPPLLAATGAAPLPDRKAARPARSGEFHGLREYRDGDDPRQIHWRSSARRGRLLLREHEDDVGGAVVVRLVVGATLRENEELAFEDAVSMTASVALWFLKQGYEVSLLAGQVSLQARSGAQHGQEILSALALLTLDEAKSPGNAVPNKAMIATVAMTQGAPQVSVTRGTRGAAA